MILKYIFYLLYKLKGWKKATNIPAESQRCVMLAAPHTSNWDIVFTAAAFHEMGVPLKFTIKKEWFRFPFNLLIGPMGGIPIDRSPRKNGEKRLSMVEAMADLFNNRSSIAVTVTPEGTRQRNDCWRTGFWHTAKLAGVPICLGYLDYQKKIAGVGPVIWPNNLDEDMRTIMKFYKTIPTSHPEKFALDSRYSEGP